MRPDSKAEHGKTDADLGEDWLDGGDGDTPEGWNSADRLPLDPLAGTEE
jgi:hypothetical protein